MPRSQAVRTPSESLAASPTLEETAACLASSSVTSTRPCWTSVHWSRTLSRHSETVACCRNGLQTSCSTRKWHRPWSIQKPARKPRSVVEGGGLEVLVVPLTQIQEKELPIGSTCQ